MCKIKINYFEVMNVENADETSEPEVGKFRTILPQVLAASIKNLLIVQIGMAQAFPTIVIPALRGTIERDPNEVLEFTEEEASWFGSITFICQPIGAFLSGWIVDPLGRKKSMMLVNIPYVMAWIILYYANSVAMMYSGAILLGLGVGLTEAPVITYIGEICQPSVRGVLISSIGVSIFFGICVVFLYGAVMQWRIAALMCLILPILIMIVLCIIPETPMWFISKNRKEEALKSLQWLRGWVSPEAVEKEFKEMERYNENMKKCSDCQHSGAIECPHPPASFITKIKDIFKPNTIKPMLLVIALFFFGQFSGIMGMRPFLVQIFKAYGVPVDASNATVEVGISSFVGGIACMILIHFVGKRRLCLISYITLSACSLFLGGFAEYNFPPNYNSFDLDTEIKVPPRMFPLILFYLYGFCSNLGALAIPWFLLSEVFTFNVRGYASGLCGGIAYFLTFIASKTYLNLDKGLSLNGVMWFYAAINIGGMLFSYFLLPETEGRKLEDIEEHFSDKSKNVWDLEIKKENKHLSKWKIECGDDNGSIKVRINRAFVR